MNKVSRKDWTPEEREFDRLACLSESKNQVLRIKGRLDLDKFVEKHGKEKCDQMWERIK